MNVLCLFVLTSFIAPSLVPGLPARGLCGEGYRGHVFWDEVQPPPSRSLRRDLGLRFTI